MENKINELIKLKTLEIEELKREISILNKLQKDLDKVQTKII